jgi:RNA polymerase sigma factor for flagellar operon FliA
MSVAIPNYYKTQQREQMIEDHLQIVKYQALRLHARIPSHVDINDLINYGIIGLMDAVEKYDASRGVKFKTYAELRVRGAILDGLRELDWVPRSYRRRQRELEAAFRTLERRHGRAATDEEVAQELGLELEEYFNLLDELRGINLGSFESSDPDSDESQIQYIPDREDNLPTIILEKKELRSILASCIDELPEKEQYVLSLYYFEGLTMKEVGKVLGITESRVSQLHSKSVLRLRGKMKNILGKER